MLRFRSLTKKGNRFELITQFQPSPDEILDDRLSTTACMVVFDFTRKVNCIEVLRPRIALGNKQFPLPSLLEIRQEIGYMFQLFESLTPYETLPQTQKSQDLPPVSA